MTHKSSADAKDRGLARLEDEMVEDVFAMSDEQIEAELREDDFDTGAIDKKIRDLFAAAIDNVFAEATAHCDLRSTANRAAYRAVQSMRDDPDFDLLAHSPEMSERLHELRADISGMIIARMNEWVRQ